jgi:hypothetical protein
VGINGNRWNERNIYNDNTLIPLMYIPPENRRSEFLVGKVVKTRHAQTDIMPTLFELLNGRYEDNSFAYQMHKSASRGARRYDDCHVLAQPYAGAALGVVRGDEKYIYEVSKKTLSRYDLVTDIFEKNPELVETDLEYDDFVSKYYCRRLVERRKDRVVVLEETLHLGDQKITKKWKKAWREYIGMKPTKNMSAVIDLEPGTEVTHMEFTSQGMNRGHKLLLNGEEIGITCKTSSKRIQRCMVELPEPVTITQESNEFGIKLKRSGDGNYDDSILFKVAAITL